MSRVGSKFIVCERLRCGEPPIHFTISNICPAHLLQMVSEDNPIMYEITWREEQRDPLSNNKTYYNIDTVEQCLKDGTWILI